MSIKLLHFFQFFLFFVILFSFPTSNTFAVEDYNFYERRGIVQFNEEMFDYAVESFNLAIRLNSNSFTSYAYLGYIALKRNNRNDAYVNFEHSLEINNEQADIHFRVGELDDYFWNSRKALLHFNEALRIDPEHYWALIGKARILSLQGKYAESDEIFKQAYEINKEKSSEYLRAGKRYLNQRNYASAIIYLRRAITENPASTDAYFELATTYRAQNRAQEAIAVLEQLKYRQPHNVNTYVHIANIYYTTRISNNRYRELQIAEANIRKAISLNETNARYYELLAGVLFLMSRDDEAREAQAKGFELSN